MLHHRRTVLYFLTASLIAPACRAEALTPAPQPADDPAPFAASRSAVRYWPVVTSDPRWNEVSMQLEGGGFSGVELRCFNAPRPSAHADNPTRRHVGVDLFARPGDAIVAVEAGRIDAFYPFLRARTGEMTYALLVAHDGYVANYGEVRARSLSTNGLSIGDDVTPGQHIAEASDTEQLHFETYLSGTTRNQSWRHGAARPSRVLNPTQMLLDLAQHGLRAQ